MSDQNDRKEELDVSAQEPAEEAAAAAAEEIDVPHEHHHHHHHHHHHRHKTKAGRFFSKIKRFVRKHRRALMAILIISLAALVLLIATLVITYGAMNKRNDPNESETQGSGDTDGKEAKVLIRLQDEPYLLVQPPILSYVDKDSTAEPRQIQDVYNIRTTRADYGYGVVINYAIVNVERHLTVTSVTVTLSQNEDYSDARVIRVTKQGVNQVTFDCLETGRLYYFKIDAALDNGVVLTTEHYFYTVTSPRLFNLEGMTNVRDIGGWMYIDGKKAIKQGMLFRGSEFDGLNGDGTLASSASRDALLTKLNVASVVDLRGADKHIPGLNELGRNVNVLCTNAPRYDEIMYRDRDEFDTQTEKDRAAAAKEQIRQIFTYLADESHYPIYMHDVYGVDETGTVCALLEAYLGVTEQDIIKDYQMSTFSLSSVDRASFNQLLNLIKKRSQHGSLQEGAMLYLRDDCGVSAEDLMRINDILLENARGVIAYQEVHNEASAATEAE